MSNPNLQDQFDQWARTYDADVTATPDDFPFAGYEQVLTTIYRQAAPTPGMSILDLGIGTGNLSRLFLKAGCRVTGVDFSAEMLVRARAKLPPLQLVQADLTADDWPAALNRPFDRIVSNYLFHEFPFRLKLHILTHLARHISAPIIVGDIIFPTRQARDDARAAAGGLWDEEDYWILEEDGLALQAAGWGVEHEQISFCAGVLTLTPPLETLRSADSAQGDGVGRETLRGADAVQGDGVPASDTRQQDAGAPTAPNPQSPTPHLLSILQALLVTFLWSTSWVFIKIGLEEIPPLTFAGLRYALAFLALLPVMAARRQHQALRRLTRADWLRLTVLGVLLFAVTQGTQFLALDLLPAATLSLLLNFTTVIVAVMSYALIAERPTRRQLLGVAIFLAGTLLYFTVDLRSGALTQAATLLGLFIAAIGVLSNAASTVLGRAVNRARQLSPLLVSFVSMAIGALLLLVVGILVQGLPPLSLQSWLIIAWLAVVNTAFAYTLWNKTQRALTAVESSIINNTMLIQIAILAWLFLGETLHPVQVAGLLLAAVGIFISQLRQARAGQAAPPPSVPEESRTYAARSE